MVDPSLPRGYDSRNLAQAIFSRYHKELLGFAIGQAQRLSLDRTDAEDAVQLLYLKIMKQPDQFREKFQEREKGYLKVCIRNTLISCRRRLTIKQRIFEELIYNLPSDSEPANQETIQEQEEFWDEIRKFLSDDRYYEPLYRFYHGYSHKEIAELMKISASVVGVRIHRAKQMLKQWLDQPPFSD